MVTLIFLGALLAHLLIGTLLVKHTLLRAARRIYAAELTHMDRDHGGAGIDKLHRGQIKRRTYGYVFVVLFFWEVIPFLWWAFVQLRATKVAIDETIIRADPDYVRGLEHSELGHHRIELSADDVVDYGDRAY
jgi:hypothetical protein